MQTPSPSSSPTPTPIATQTTSTVEPVQPSAPPPRETQGWDTLVGVLALLIGIASFAFGLKKPDLSTFWKTLLYVLEVLALFAGMVLLGWLGVVLLVIGMLVTLAVHSVRLAMKQESILTSAGIEDGRDASEMKELHGSLMRSHKAFKWFGSIKTANLIRLLAQRHRSPDEIRSMALPIVMLLAAFEPGPLDSLVERFDRILRLSGKPSDESMSLADTLTAGTQHGAATLNEMIDALISFYTQEPYDSTD